MRHLQEDEGKVIWSTSGSTAPPFSKTGVDFAGSLFVKGKGKQMRKVYIALFTCCVTRAVHLELVEDLSTETFKR